VAVAMASTGMTRLQLRDASYYFPYIKSKSVKTSGNRTVRRKKVAVQE